MNNPKIQLAKANRFVSQKSWWVRRRVPLELVVTKHLCAPRLLPHYQFAQIFLERGEKAAKAAEVYPVNLSFVNRPIGVERIPSWWLMPWLQLPKKARLLTKEKMHHKQRIFLNLLKSVESNGFKWGMSGPITGHYLQMKGQHRFINTDGHHRLSIYALLFDLNLASNRDVPIRITGIYDAEIVIQQWSDNSSDNPLFTAREARGWCEVPFLD